MLARYLLVTYEEKSEAAELQPHEYTINPRLYSAEQLTTEAAAILHKLEYFSRRGLSEFHSFAQHGNEHFHHARQEKKELLEQHHVYDKNLLAVLKTFCGVALALLIKLERLHKKHILCGNVNPYTFFYDKKQYSCEPVDLSTLLSDKNLARAEKLPFGNLIYVHANLSDIKYTSYLAPELRESVLVYKLHSRLKDLVDEAAKHGIKLANQPKIKLMLHDFHQKQIKYSDRAEIYSVGYTLNQIFSHTLSKLAHFNMLMNEFITTPVAQNILAEAELLLPDKFLNHERELVVSLTNEAIKYIHDLMHEHMEKRATLELSIARFMSLLKRISVTKPDTILEEEEEEGEGETESGHDHNEQELEEEHEEEEEQEQEEEAESEAEAEEEEELEHEEEAEESEDQEHEEELEEGEEQEQEDDAEEEGEFEHEKELEEQEEQEHEEEPEEAEELEEGEAQEHEEEPEEAEEQEQEDEEPEEGEEHADDHEHEDHEPHELHTHEAHDKHGHTDSHTSHTHEHDAEHGHTDSHDSQEHASHMHDADNAEQHESDEHAPDEPPHKRGMRFR